MTKTNHTETATEATKAEIPAAARDLALRAVKEARERAEALKASAEKATAEIESGLKTTSGTIAEASRNIQDAIHEDVKAGLAAVEKIAAAKSLAEAAQIQIDYLSARSQVDLARVVKVTEYLSKTFQDGAKSAQDAFARMAAKATKAA